MDLERERDRGVSGYESHQQWMKVSRRDKRCDVVVQTHQRFVYLIRLGRGERMNESERVIGHDHTHTHE